MPKKTPKNILIAPLDWGAGHTTRCMPIIRHLLQMGNRVYVAGNAAQQAMVREAFADEVQLLALEGYNISYSPINKYAQAGLLLQMPRVLQAIKREHQWLQETVKKYEINGIISDNRYGLYHGQVPAVIMTHQLQVLTGMGSTADNVIRRLHYRYLNQFSGTWVVDAVGADSLAGRLAQVKVLPKNAQYMGLLSRFAGDGYNYYNEAADTLLVLLSGPEPQRSILSGILWRQLLNYKGKVIFAEGSDNASTPAEVPAHITYDKRLAGAALQNALKEAKVVICRSGYSTLMDLAATGKNAILIPTPGQTEQEYLGKLMADKGLFCCVKQEAFELHQALKLCAGYNNREPAISQCWHKHQPILAAWANALP